MILNLLNFLIPPNKHTFALLTYQTTNDKKTGHYIFISTSDDIKFPNLSIWTTQHVD